MPNPAIPFQLNKATIIPEIVMVSPDTNTFYHYLRASGYLFGIAVNPNNGYAELRCQLQNVNGESIEDEFYLEYGYASGGILLRQPLVNMNSMAKYRLLISRFKTDSPPIPNLTIYPISCWQ